VDELEIAVRRKERVELGERFRHFTVDSLSAFRQTLGIRHGSSRSCREQSRDRFAHRSSWRDRSFWKESAPLRARRCEEKGVATKMVRPIVLLCTAAVVLAACGERAANDSVERGKYLVTIAGCGDCHTPGIFSRGKPDEGKALAGSDVGFFMPGLGYFWGPNLTPDDETGLGKWNAQEIVTAIRTGKRPDGRVLAPVMPWQNLAKLTDDDAHAIAAYLKSLAPISNKVAGPFGVSEKPTAQYFIVMSPDAAPPAASAPPAETPPATTPETPPTTPEAPPTSPQ
jgi:mono/diheme cytochrome c family protein